MMRIEGQYAVVTSRESAHTYVSTLQKFWLIFAPASSHPAVAHHLVWRSQMLCLSLWDMFVRR